MEEGYSSVFGSKELVDKNQDTSRSDFMSVWSLTPGVLAQPSGAAHQLPICSFATRNKRPQCDFTGSSSHDYDGWDNVNGSQLIIVRLALDRYDKNKDATLHLSPPAKPGDPSRATGAAEHCDGAALSRGKNLRPRLEKIRE